MKIVRECSLKDKNTFGFDVKADIYAEVESKEELKLLLSNSEYSQIPKIVVGSGSNILFRRDFKGIVIHPAIMDISIVGNDCDYIYLRAGAGVVWDDLVQFCVDRGWGGVENLSAIPGCAGAAPVQNIGAYGAEVANVIHAVEFIFYNDLSEREFSCGECNFGYRDSIFKRELKGCGIITYVTLKLSKNPVINANYEDVQHALHGLENPSIHNVRDIISSIRASKLPDPSVIGNAGSFFKNPVVSEKLALSIKNSHPSLKLFPSGEKYYKIPAAWLIEQCGFKGKRFGNVGVHANQPLVLLAFEGATGDELINLSHTIIQTVKERFNVDIEPEVNIC
jgi:UDP-N-acetylmuramate dehydrogenase